MSSDPRDPEYDDWPVSRDGGDSMFVGTTGTAGGAAGLMPVYYDHETNSFYGARREELTDEIERIQDQSWDLDPEETIGEGIERLGDELGWEQLSEFAEEHLEDDES